MNKRTLLLFSGTHAAAIMIGVFSGWYLDARLKQYAGALRHVWGAAAYSLQVDLLRRQGQIEDYHDALLANLAFLGELQRERDPFLTRPIVQGDTVLTLARLARG